MPLRESPQAVKQHAVPQNIMQVEFKIIGELTMRQFMYLLTFSGFAFAAFSSELPSLVKLPLTAVLALSGIAFAFLPIEERGLDQWVINFLSAVFSPTQRVWKKEVKTPYYFAYHTADLIKSQMVAVAPTSSRRKLEKYLETEGSQKKRDPLDIFDQEDDYIRKVREVLNNPSTTSAVPTAPSSSYFSYATTTVAPTVKVRTEEEIISEIASSPEPAPYSDTGAPRNDKSVTLNSFQGLPEKVLKPVQHDTTQIRDGNNVIASAAKQSNSVSLTVPTVEIKSLEITDSKTVIKESRDLWEKTVEDRPKIEEKIPNQVRDDNTRVRDDKNVVIPEFRPSEISEIQPGSRVKPGMTEQKPMLTPISTEKPTPVDAPMIEPVTPDRLTGRRFTHLTKTEGEIVLPIRGERVLRTVSEDLDEDVNKKADELLALVEKVRKEHEKLRTVKEGENLSKEEEETKVPLSDVAKKAVEDAALKNAELAKQIEALKAMSGSSVKNPQEKEVIDTKVKELQEERFNAEEQIKTLKQQISDLEERLSKGGDQPKVIIQRVIEKVHVPVFDTEFEEKKPAIPPQKPTLAKTPAFTNIPNVINGIIKDEKGILLEGAVVVIKDSRGDTVRALKTNKLGQFLITTPVSSGAYVIEITKPGIKTVFVPISIEVKGEVLPPVEITGKL